MTKKENDRIEKALKLARDRYRFYNSLLKTPIKKENENDRDRIKSDTK